MKPDENPYQSPQPAYLSSAAQADEDWGDAVGRVCFWGSYVVAIAVAIFLCLMLVSKLTLG